MAARYVGQQIRDWFYGQNQGSNGQQQQAQAAGTNAYQNTNNQYQQQYNSGAQNQGQQVAAHPGNAYSQPQPQPQPQSQAQAQAPQAAQYQYPTQPQAQFKYVEQESDGKSVRTTFDSSRLAAYPRNPATPAPQAAPAPESVPAPNREMTRPSSAHANPVKSDSDALDGVAYMRSYDRVGAATGQRTDNLFTQYRTSHLGSPGARLQRAGEEPPAPTALGSKWW